MILSQGNPGPWAEELMVNFTNSRNLVLLSLHLLDCIEPVSGNEHRKLVISIQPEAQMFLAPRNVKRRLVVNP